MSNYNTELFSRNRGLISEKEQEALAKTSIAIIGAGGDGGLLAERLVRFGIGKIILADPEVFETANSNRQFAANVNSIGKNKAGAVAAELILINPDLDITVYAEGVTPQNVATIVKSADIIIDEIEYSIPFLSVMLHKEAREQHKFIFMGANIGWGASIFCFHPKGVTFEEHFQYNETEKTINPLRYLKTLPGYLTEETIACVLEGNMPMPAVSSSVSLVAAIMCSEIILFITGKRNPVAAPQFLFIDLFDLSISKI